MSGALDTKFAFINAIAGPGARKGNNIPWSPPSKEHMPGPIRSHSLPKLNVPAGHSAILGNKLGLATYGNLSGKYHARFDVPPPCKAPRQMSAHHKMKVDSWSEGQMPRLKPETLPPAGNKVERIKGKRLVMCNTNNSSNADTLIWGRDVDGSLGLPSHPSEDPFFNGSAGLYSNPRDRAPWGELPPTCKRTFGATDEENDWEAAHYERLDPRLNQSEYM